MTIRLIALTGLLMAVASAPAVAAPSLEPLKACYVSAGEADERREGVVLRGSGFTPNAALRVYIDGLLVMEGQSDVVGGLAATVKAPFLSAGEREFGVTVVERDNPVNAADSMSRVTALSVTLRPREARPSRRVQFRGRGFTGAGPVYAHYVFGGKLRRTIRLTRSRARAREPQLAVGRVHLYPGAGRVVALQQAERQRVDQPLRDHALQRARPVRGVVAHIAQQVARRVGERHVHAALGHAADQPSHLEVDDLAQLLA